MQNKHSRCSFTAVITAKLSMFLYTKGTKYNRFCQWKLFFNLWVSFPETKWNGFIFVLGHRAPLLWQQINPSFSFAVIASGVPFGTCHFDSLPPMLLSSSLLCSLASVDQRIASESREVKCVRTSCRRVQMLLQKQRGIRLCSAHVQCVCARLFTATSQDTTHLTRLLLALLRHWKFTAATVYQCPWVGDNLPSFPATALPLRWTSWLAVAHLRWTHMSTCMCDARAPPWLYPLHLLQIIIDLIINQGSSTVLCA